MGTRVLISAGWYYAAPSGATIPHSPFADLQSREEAAELSHAEWLGFLIDREAPNGSTNRSTKRYQTRMRAAKLRHAGAAIEGDEKQDSIRWIDPPRNDCRAPRQLDRDLFRQRAHGDRIGKRQNLIITGPCGVGKTRLACAPGQKACRDGRTVVYHRLPRLTAELELAHGDGRFPGLFRQLVRTDLFAVAHRA